MKASKSLLYTVLFLSHNLSAQWLDNNSINTLPIETNPALTGIFSSGNLNLGYHSYFDEYSYKTSFANYQTHLSALNSGIGININQINQGFYSRTMAGLAYAYHHDLNQTLSLSLGLGATLNSFNSAYFMYTTHSPYFQNRMDFSSGLVLHHDRFFVSISANQLNRLGLPFQLNTIYGHKFRIQRVKGLELIPSIRYSLMNKYRNLETTLNVNYKGFKSVLGYRFNDSFNFGIGYHWNRISLQYSILKSTSTLGETSAIYHQIGLQLKLPKTINRQTKALDFRLF